MARLVVTTPHGEEVVELEPGQVVTVGRDPTNRVPLPDDNQASRRHCRIGPRDSGGGGWEVVDLGSTNKTRVAGAPITRRALGDGDVVEVGHARLKFEDPDEAGRAAQAEKEGVCYLEWANKDRRGEKVMLSERRVTIGRRETNVLVIDDRMASGHHCEIDRDMNGYTVKDLGSTNGTLVNGELVSEALLTHGTRLRVGNSRFVFKDPSMKDVEVELAQFEEDEGWGMMGEIDLARAPGSRAGPLLVLVLFLAAGAGGYLLSQREGGGTSEQVAGAGGLLDNGDFEGGGLAWSTDDPERVDVAARAGAGDHKSTGLVVSVSDQVQGPSLVAYDTPIDATPELPLSIEAKARKSGDADARLVVVWDSNPSSDERTGLVTPLTRTDTILAPGTSWTPVHATLAPPAWARIARIGVLLAPGARISVDDVRVERAAGHEAVALDVPVFKKAFVDTAGRMDLQAGRRVLLTGVAPIAKTADGTILDRFVPSGAVALDGGTIRVEGTLGTASEKDGAPAKLTWTRAKEGLVAHVEVEGASAVGLDAMMPEAYTGGAVSALGDFVPQRFPAEAGQHLEKVQRSLIGEADEGPGKPSTLVQIATTDDQSSATLELLAPDGQDALLVVRTWLPGASGDLSLTTDFSSQRDVARKELEAAKLLRDRRPAEALDQLRRIAQANPFNPEVRDQAIQIAGELEGKVRDELTEGEASLARFRVYGSADSLADVKARAKRFTERFLGGPDPADRPLVKRVQEFTDQVGQAETAWELDRATPVLDRLERLVDLLGEEVAYRPVAAVYARALLARYQDLAASSPDLAKRLADVKQKLDKLEATPEVQAALPPKP